MFLKILCFQIQLKNFLKSHTFSHLIFVSDIQGYSKDHYHLFHHPSVFLCSIKVIYRAQVNVGVFFVEYIKNLAEAFLIYSALSKIEFLKVLFVLRIIFTVIQISQVNNAVGEYESWMGICSAFVIKTPEKIICSSRWISNHLKIEQILENKKFFKKLQLLLSFSANNNKEKDQ